MIKIKGIIEMEFKGKKLELDLEELMPLLMTNKQEAFRHIG
ncbi:hypothetical protein [Sulfurimonas sp.]|nr:hypothetical protein [Sulfurimonas sp.]